MGVVVQGGTAPYTYAWKKGTSTVSGQTSATLRKPALYPVMPGFIPAWLLMPMAL
ncbi:tail protein [Klebsiella pneumoniae]|nr:tail protein [Klebsiella pneumoniae]